MEQEWIERIREGDATAFSEMVTAYYSGLFDYAYGLTGSPQAAEDLIQDVLLAIWERRSAWRPSHSVKAYLFGAVRNRAHNFRRDKKPSASEIDLPDEDDPDATLRFHDLFADYRAAVAGMPERRRQVFRLSRLYGLTYEEIGEVLGISVNTVRSQISEALVYLRDRLSEHLGR
jgi:RNA polymerase sigma-70 factor (ECF subfamily)